MKTKRTFSLGQLLPWCAGLPLILGTWGYCLAYYYDVDSVTPSSLAGYISLGLRAIYRSIVLYGLNMDEKVFGFGKHGYWPLEAARWIALAVTTSVFVSILRMAISRMSAHLRSLQRDAVALHGDQNLTALIRGELGAKAISGGVPELYRAKRHILAFQSESAMYEYLVAHNAHFFADGSKTIYLCTLKAAYPSNREGGIFVSNMAENCARLYWEERFLRRGERSVAIVGFEEYGMQLLMQALMVNVFRTPRQIRYTVYGDRASFMALHPHIGRIVSVGREKPGWDSLFFVDGPWESHLAGIAAADRVIGCANADEENFRLLDRLIECGATGRIDVRAIHADLPRRLWRGDEENIGVFGTNDRLYTLDVILRESLLRRAKMIHARYVRYEPHTSEVCASRKCDRAPQCHDCDAFEASWDALGAFKRGSNITQADHMSVKVREVLGEDVPMNADTVLRFKRAYELMKHSDKLPLFELEHNRWMRYHLINGWSYAPVRDNANKRHHLLVSYDELPEEQWSKDEDAYVIIPEIFARSQGAR